MALKVARSTASRRLKKLASPAVFESGGGEVVVVGGGEGGGGKGGSKRKRMSSAFHILYPRYSGSPLTLTPLGYGKPAPFLNVVLALGL